MSFKIQNVVSRALANGFQSATLYSAAEEAVQKCAPEPPCLEAVAAKFADALSFTLPVAKFVKDEVEKNSLNKGRTEEQFVKLAEVVENYKIKIEDGILTKPVDAARSPKPTGRTYPQKR